MWQKPAKRAKSRQEKEVLETVVPTPLPYYITKVSQVLNFFWS